MNKVDCSKVIVKTSTFCDDDNIFDGAFANVDIKKGELVEKGIVRRIDCNGQTNPFVFTWSDDIPNNTWAFSSGCLAFYNTNVKELSNTRVVRYFKEDRFEVFAKNDIKKDEELTHTYKSLEWRDTFKDLNKNLKMKINS